VDVLVIHYVAGLEDDAMDMAALKWEADKAGKAVFFWLMGRREGSEAFHKNARKNGLAVHGEISRISECLSAAGRFKAQRGHPESPPSEKKEMVGDVSVLLEKHASQNPILDEHDSKLILQKCGLPVVQEKIVGTAEKTLDAAREMGYPLVLKGLVPGEMHKTESGLVYLDIKTEHELERVFEKLRQKVEGKGRILIQKQVKKDYELIAGFLRDREFGPCVMFGLGGMLAELTPDVAFALAPLQRQEALELMKRIRGKRLLEGFRGIRPLNRESMTDILVALADIGTEYPFIEQIDINPVAVHQGIPLPVDATIILNKGVTH